MNSLTAQDFPSLQAAFDAAKNTGHYLYIPKADYWLDEPIRIIQASEKPITSRGAIARRLTQLTRVIESHRLR